MHFRFFPIKAYDFNSKPKKIETRRKFKPEEKLMCEEKFTSIALIFMMHVLECTVFLG